MGKTRIKEIVCEPVDTSQAADLAQEPGIPRWRQEPGTRDMWADLYSSHLGRRLTEAPHLGAAALQTPATEQ